jgi:competence protein ComEC
VQTQRHVMLFDTGPDFSGESDSGNRILIPTLRGLGINRLDGLMISHDDIDHAGGTASVIQALPIAWVSSSMKVDNPLLKGASNYRHCIDGNQWNWDGVDFEVLHPTNAIISHGKPHDNELSCVLRISIGDQHILLVGDIQKHSEARLLQLHEDKLHATLLVAPHHGSKSSSTEAFIAAVAPRYVVFTSGYRNRFKHPNPEVAQRYAKHGAESMRSDADGAILIDMNAQGLQVERYRKTHQRYWTHALQTTVLTP